MVDEEAVVAVTAGLQLVHVERITAELSNKTNPKRRFILNTFLQLCLDMLDDLSTHILFLSRGVYNYTVSCVPFDTVSCVPFDSKY